MQAMINDYYLLSNVMMNGGFFVGKLCKILIPIYAPIVSSSGFSVHIIYNKYLASELLCTHNTTYIKKLI